MVHVWSLPWDADKGGGDLLPKPTVHNEVGLLQTNGASSGDAPGCCRSSAFATAFGKIYTGKQNLIRKADNRQLFVWKYNFLARKNRRPLFSCDSTAIGRTAFGRLQHLGEWPIGQTTNWPNGSWSNATIHRKYDWPTEQLVERTSTLTPMDNIWVSGSHELDVCACARTRMCVSAQACPSFLLWCNTLCYTHIRVMIEHVIACAFERTQLKITSWLLMLSPAGRDRCLYWKYTNLASNTLFYLGHTNNILCFSSSARIDFGLLVGKKNTPCGNFFTTE